MGYKIRRLPLLFSILIVLILSGCSVSRHVPQGSYLLDSVKINIVDSCPAFTEKTLMPFVHQRPNNRFLHLTRLRLGVYNLSGNDSTKWWNKWMRRLGEAPVIFDPFATASDSLQLLRALNNAGYLQAKVNVDSVVNHKKRTLRLNYNINAGTPHIIRSIEYKFPDDTIADIVMRDSARLPIKEGDPLDRDRLDYQREYIVNRLRNRGYWAFTKDLISFNADTTEGSHMVDLEMLVKPAIPIGDNFSSIDSHSEYLIRNVAYLTDFNNAQDIPEAITQSHDSLDYKGIRIFYGDKKYLRPEVLYENCFLIPGAIFRQRDVNSTYTALGRLSILKFVQIRLIPVGSIGHTGLLDAFILLTPTKSQYFSAELEGTNSDGDLGVALGLNYTHRNAGKGSETLDFKLRGSYQAVSGNLDGLIHHRVTEYGAETSVTFPKFKAPFLRDSFKKKIKASTQLHISINYQERPEYSRIISTAGWSYKWTEHATRYRFTLTPVDINYVFLPKSTNNFIDLIAPDNPLLKYSYEDHFIMRQGFNFYYTNKRQNTAFRQYNQQNIYTFRAQAETAGNFLYALSSAFDHRHRKSTDDTDADTSHDNPSYFGSRKDPYKIFGINYSQYIRGDADFTYLHSFNRRNALAFYTGFGIGIPYGNSSILPFEKRFYGGGANGVRGWDVRTLGPGRFPGTNSVSDFIYQCGDIKFNLSLEYRIKLFWVVEGALFIDAGNIWTIHDYDTQPYGMFRFDSFYKELAAAYGVGIRLDFNYFLVRFDMGMKAHNPAINQDPWPLVHPKWGRDHSFHFSIGYPF